MYVDESGDCGLVNSPTRYFILTGIVLHETDWNTCFEQILEFRRSIRDRYGLKLREEFHAHAFVKRPGDLRRIPLNSRMMIMRSYADRLASLSEISIINIVVDKQGKSPSFSVFESSWKYLIQRFHNTIIYGNFPNSAHDNEHGLIFPDRTDDKKLTGLLRKMGRYNPVPSMQGFGDYRNLKIERIAEDPNFRDSAHSLFIQSADLSAYLLQQHLNPCKTMKRKSGQNYFLRLQPVLCKVASKTDPFGIVRI